MKALTPALAEELLGDQGTRTAQCGGKNCSLLSLLSGLLIGLGFAMLLSGNGQPLMVQEPAATNLATQYMQAAKGSMRQVMPLGKAHQFPQPASGTMSGNPTRNVLQLGAPQFMQAPTLSSMPQATRRQSTLVNAISPRVDLTGKIAFLAGADSEQGYGWAIAKELADAGATVLFGVWPMALKIFEMNWKKESMEEARKLRSGGLLEVAKVYPLDAVYDDPSKVPDEVKNNKRYKDVGGFTIQEVVDAVAKDYGKIDILVHSLANGPEVTKPLLETSREGYLAASSASAYSLVSMISRFGPIMNPGGSVVSLTYIASQKVIPGYGGGMSSAKAQLESDTRTLAYEAGTKFGIRVNTISAGPLASRAATAISKGAKGDKPFIVRAREYSETNAPLSTPLVAQHVGTTALFLLTELAAGVTGAIIPVDMGLSVMGQSLDSPAWDGSNDLMGQPLGTDKAEATQ